MLAHEIFAGLFQRLGFTCGKAQLDRIRRMATRNHCIVNPLARCRRNHTRCIARNQHVTAIVPAFQRFQRDRRTFAADRLERIKPCRLTQCLSRFAQRKPLVRAAKTDACSVTVREYPGVEIGRVFALINHVTAVRIESCGTALGHFYDFVIGKNAWNAVSSFQLLSRHARAGTVGTDHRAGPRTCFRPAAPLTPDDARDTVRVAVDALECTSDPYRPRLRRPRAEPFVEYIAVDHAHRPIPDRHIDTVPRRGDHAGERRLCNHQTVGNVKITIESWRNGPAARLDPSGTVKQQNMAALMREVGCRCRPRWAATDDDRVVIVTHTNTPLGRAGADDTAPAASHAATRNSPASTAKTFENARPLAPVSARIASTPTAPVSPPRPNAIA